MNDPLFTKAKELYPNAPDQEIEKGLIEIRQKAPEASDDEILQAASKMKQASEDGSLQKQMLNQSLKEKYNLGQYSPEERTKLQDNVKDSGNPIAAALSGFGAGLRKGDVGAAFKSTMDMSQADAKEKLTAFDKARENVSKDFSFDRDLTKAEREDKAFNEKGDPNSDKSKAYQATLVEDYGFNPELAKKMSAEQIEARIPSLKDKATRRFEQQKLALEKQKHDDTRTDNAVSRDLKEREFSLREKIAKSTDENEKLKLTQQADEIAHKRDAMNLTAGGKPMTPDQGKVATFADRIAQAEKNFQDLENSGYNRADITSGVGSKLPNIIKSKEAQRQGQAERNFINAVLRRESGAAISPAEFASAEEQYFPRAGDTQETLAQKKQNRDTILKGFIREAGPHYKTANTEAVAAEKAPSEKPSWAK